MLFLSIQIHIQILGITHQRTYLKYQPMTMMIVLVATVIEQQPMKMKDSSQL